MSPLKNSSPLAREIKSLRQLTEMVIGSITKVKNHGRNDVDRFFGVNSKPTIKILDKTQGALTLDSEIEVI